MSEVLLLCLKRNESKRLEVEMFERRQDSVILRPRNKQFVSLLPGGERWEHVSRRPCLEQGSRPGR